MYLTTLVSAAESPRRLVLVVALAGALIGCPPSAPTTGYEHLNDEIAAQLAEVGLGSGDVFEVRVYGEKELSGVHRISPDGAIDFPLVGRLAVSGRSPDQIAEALAERLRDGYLKDPFVSVYVQEYNSKKIFVLGDVAQPGTFPYRGGMNVVEAITLAGGFKNTANPNYVVVTRRSAEGERTIPVPVEKISKGLAANLELQAGDIVFVPDKLL